MIPSANIPISSNLKDDIFSYMRNYYQTTDLNESDLVEIVASSTILTGNDSQAPASTLISGIDGKRWVSYYEEKANFTIDFHSNFVDLRYYSIENNKSFRFINSWDLYGINYKEEILIDRQQNNPICDTELETCQENTIKTFKCQHPNLFHSFKMVHTSTDSMDENLFSMTKIRFYGSINAIYQCYTDQKCKIPISSISHLIYIVFFT